MGLSKYFRAMLGVMLLISSFYGNSASAQGAELFDTTKVVPTNVSETAAEVGVQAMISNYSNFMQNFAYSLGRQYEVEVGRFFGQADGVSWVSSLNQSLISSVNLSLPTMMWLLLSAYIGFLAFIRRKSALTL